MRRRQKGQRQRSRRPRWTRSKGTPGGVAVRPCAYGSWRRGRRGGAGQQTAVGPTRVRRPKFPQELPPTAPPHGRPTAHAPARCPPRRASTSRFAQTFGCLARRAENDAKLEQAKKDKSGLTTKDLRRKPVEPRGAFTLTNVEPSIITPVPYDIEKVVAKREG